MTQLAFPFSPPTLAIAGSALRFPVGRIFCVGRNYAAHTREMGGDPAREPPFFFMKGADAVVTEADIPYPVDTEDLHHEVELVAALGEGGRVFGYAVGVDLTKRDRQNDARAEGLPWERAKAFERSAPISPIRPAAECGDVENLALTLAVNGVAKQNSTTAHMIWSVRETLARHAQIWTPRAGDLLFTGTPEGIGPVARGERVTAAIAGVGELAFRLV